MFLAIYIFAVVQILSKMHEHVFLWFGRNMYQNKTGCKLLWIILLLHAVHTWGIWIDIMHTVLTISLCVLYSVENWKYQEVRSSDVIRNATSQCRNEIQNDWLSEWYWNWDLSKSKQVCQPIDRLWSCVDLTNSNVISAPLSVSRPEISQVLCRCAANL
jgi:hypothetical protein